MEWFVNGGGLKLLSGLTTPRCLWRLEGIQFKIIQVIVNIIFQLTTKQIKTRGAIIQRDHANRMSITTIWLVENMAWNGVFVVVNVKQVKLLSGKPFISVSTVSPP